MSRNDTPDFKRLLDALDALPNKTLLGQCFWDAQAQCGCFFGSIVPPSVRDKHVASLVRDKGQVVFVRSSGAEWAASYRLTPAWVRGLELVNDRFVGTQTDRYQHMLRALEHAARAEPYAGDEYPEGIYRWMTDLSSGA